jgi:hypothetical protein
MIEEAQICASNINLLELSNYIKRFDDIDKNF